MKPPNIIKAERFRQKAIELQKESNNLMLEAMKIYEQESVRAFRKHNDKLINRKEAISLLWFESHQALKDWEKKVQNIGYLQFNNHKILRSEVLRFRDDYKNGKLFQKLRSSRGG